MTIREAAAKASSSPLVDEIYGRNETDPKTNASNSDNNGVPLVEARIVADEPPHWHHEEVEPTVVVEGTSTQPHSQYYTSNNQGRRQPISRQKPMNDPSYITARGPIALPGRCHIHRELNQTMIKVRWLDNSICFLLFFTVVWDYFVASMLVEGGLVMLIVPHTWIGVWLTYTVTCGFVNSTYLTITNDYLVIHQFPLKVWCWSGPTVVSFEKTGYEEVHVRRRVERRRKLKYEVQIVDLESGVSTDVPMLVSMSKEEALFVTQEVRKYLTPSTTEASAPTEMGVV